MTKTLIGSIGKLKIIKHPFSTDKKIYNKMHPHQIPSGFSNNPKPALKMRVPDFLIFFCIVWFRVQPVA